MTKRSRASSIVLITVSDILRGSKHQYRHADHGISVAVPYCALINPIRQYVKCYCLIGSKSAHLGHPKSEKCRYPAVQRSILERPCIEQMSIVYRFFRCTLFLWRVSPYAKALYKASWLHANPMVPAALLVHILGPCCVMQLLKLTMFYLACVRSQPLCIPSVFNPEAFPLTNAAPVRRCVDLCNIMAMYLLRSLSNAQAAANTSSLCTLGTDPACCCCAHLQDCPRRRAAAASAMTVPL